MIKIIVEKVNYEEQNKYLQSANEIWPNGVYRLCDLFGAAGQNANYSCVVRLTQMPSDDEQSLVNFTLERLFKGDYYEREGAFEQKVEGAVNIIVFCMSTDKIYLVMRDARGKIKILYNTSHRTDEDNFSVMLMTNQPSPDVIASAGHYFSNKLEDFLAMARVLGMPFHEIDGEYYVKRPMCHPDTPPEERAALEIMAAPGLTNLCTHQYYSQKHMIH